MLEHYICGRKSYRLISLSKVQFTMQLPSSLIYVCAYQFLTADFILFLLSISMQMSMQNVLTTISFLFIATTVVHSRGDVAPQVLFQKLEDALKTNKQTLYLLQKTFFPSQHLPRDLVNLDVHVTVCSVLPDKCDEQCAASGAISNFSYTQRFQWSSSPLLDLIPSGQLLTLDNVLSRVTYRDTFHFIVHGYKLNFKLTHFSMTFPRMTC